MEQHEISKSEFAELLETIDVEWTDIEDVIKSFKEWEKVYAIFVADANKLTIHTGERRRCAVHLSYVHCQAIHHVKDVHTKIKMILDSLVKQRENS
jgi:hypothetical protein